MSQQMSALRTANEVRSYKHDTKERIAAMHREDAIAEVVAIFRNPGKQGRSWSINELVGAIPWFGRKRVLALARYAKAQPTDRMCLLGLKQREAIIFALEHPKVLWPYSSVAERDAA